MGIKYRVDEKFFKKWGREMAYVLGYWYADGSLEDASYLRGKYIRVTSVDKNTILKIKKYLSSKHTVVIIEPIIKNRKTRYLLRIGSHALYNDLINLGLFPNKSLTVRLPNVPRKYLSDFVRGYFDGDGCVHLERGRNKKQKTIIKRMRVTFTSGSKVFLEELAVILKNTAELKCGAVYNGNRSFQLQYPTSDSLTLFKFMYGNVPPNLYLKRKLKIFIKYFKLRPSRIDNIIGNMLNFLNNGHVVK